MFLYSSTTIINRISKSPFNSNVKNPQESSTTPNFKHRLPQTSTSSIIHLISQSINPSTIQNESTSNIDHAHVRSSCRLVRGCSVRQQRALRRRYHRPSYTSASSPGPSHLLSGRTWGLQNHEWWRRWRRSCSSHGLMGTQSNGNPLLRKEDHDLI